MWDFNANLLSVNFLFIRKWKEMVCFVFLSAENTRWLENPVSGGYWLVKAKVSVGKGQGPLSSYGSSCNR